MAPFLWTITPFIKKTHALPVQIVLLSFSIQTACGKVFFTKQMVCLSLEKKINQYEQVFVPFLWIVGYLIKKTPASPVPIVLLSFSIQTPSVISFFTKLLMGVSLKKKRNQYEQVFVPFFWIVGYLIKKTPASPVPIVLLSFCIQTPCGIVFFIKLLVSVRLLNLWDTCLSLEIQTAKNT